MFIFLRLGGVSVWRYSLNWGFRQCRGWGDRLRRTAGVSVIFAKIVERYLDFFLSYLIALREDVSGVSLEYRHGSLVLCPGTFGVSFAMPAKDG